MIDPALLRKMQAPEFAERLARDPVIAALEEQRTSERDDLAALAQLLGGGYLLGSLKLRPLTAADWALWWALDLAFARGREPEEKDADTALWLLSRPFDKAVGTLDMMREDAAGFCAKSDIYWVDAAEVIFRIVSDVFRPLALLPPDGGDGSEPRFDADWLTAVLARVARLMQYPAHRIAVERPLAEVCYYFVWARAMNEPKLHVGRRAPAEICAAIWGRTMALAREVGDGCR